MTDRQQAMLEERLMKVEAELEQAKERVRAFEEWQQRSARACFLVAAAVALLLVVTSQTVPATASGPSMVKAPFTVVGASGKKLFQVNDGPGGGYAAFYDHSGANVVNVGSGKNGGGALGVVSGDQKTSAALSSTNSEGPALTLYAGTNAIAELGEGREPNIQVGLSLNNSKGAVAQLLVSNQSGRLVLADPATDIRVEAGTLQNGNASVKTSGPTGKCIPAIPCELVGE